MARPIKHEQHKRGEVAHTRFTLAEFEHVREQADRAGLSVSSYLRSRALGHRVRAQTSAADAALVAEINRIGVNVNQLARAVNSDRGYRGDWEGLHDKLHEVLDRLLEDVG